MNRWKIIDWLAWGDPVILNISEGSINGLLLRDPDRGRLHRLTRPLRFALLIAMAGRAPVIRNIHTDSNVWNVFGNRMTGPVRGIA
jgi:hypothetical protein